MPTRFLSAFVLALFVTFVNAATAWAQAATSLAGVITDTSGGTVPNAQVKLTDTSTGATRSVMSGGDGVYTFSQLRPGTYRLEVTAGQFKKAQIDKVVVQVGLASTLDVTLQPGDITETVNVQAEAAGINTQDASIGKPFGELQVRQLPLEARNPAQLLSLQAGVVWAGEQNLSDPRQGSVFGGRSNQGNITLDGADVNNNETQAAFTSVLPVPLDSVQEFRVTTLAPGAEHGRSSGAQVQLVTKSGTNELHGSAYYFNRNAAFASRGFFDPPGSKKSPLNRNIFGASAGGPIIKNHLFIFGNWESRRDRTATPQTRVVPTESFKDGVLIYPCATPAQCPATAVTGLSGKSFNVPAGYYGLSPSVIASTIDPCGSVPCTDVLGDRITPGPNAAMLAVFRRYPVGNAPELGPAAGGDVGINYTGFRFNPPVSVNNNDYVARLDYKVDNAGRNTVYLRGTLADDFRINTPQNFPLDVLTGQPGDPASALGDNSKGIVAGYTALISQRLVNTFRYGYTRLGFNSSGSSLPVWVTAGFSNPLAPGGTTAPRPDYRVSPTHNFADDVSLQLGKHNLQFGVNYRHGSVQALRFTSSYPTYFSLAAFLNGGGAHCVMPGSPTPDCPNAAKLAALPAINQSAGFVPYTRGLMNLFGAFPLIIGNFQFDRTGKALPDGTPQSRNYLNYALEGYAQDSFRLKSNLTVTVGLRYSYEDPPYEKNGLQVVPGLDLEKWWNDRVSGMAQGIPANRAPLLTYVLGGKANDGPSYYQPDKNNFAPRVAVAWSPATDNNLLKFLTGSSGQSSIRAGFAMAYDRIGGTLTNFLDASGVGLTTSTNNLVRGPLDYFGAATAPRFLGADKFPPAGPPLFNVPAGGFPSQVPLFAASTGGVVFNNFRTPYSMQFDFSYQRQLPKHFTMEVGYVGRQGRKLATNVDMGQWLDLRDPASGQTFSRALRDLSAQINNGTQLPTGPCATDPLTCASRLPASTVSFFENVLSNLASVVNQARGTNFTTATQAMAYLAGPRGPSPAPNWAQIVNILDNTLVLQTGRSPYSAALDPQKIGHVFLQQQYNTLQVWTNWGTSSYHGLLLSLHRRLGSFQFDANYVFSKSIDDGSTIEGTGTAGNVIRDPFNRSGSRAVSDFDLKHNFNANWVYELPFGRGRFFGSNATAWQDQLIGGWQLSGVWRWRSGFPVSVVQGTPAFSWNYNSPGFATQVGEIESSQSKNVKGFPNLFSDPATALSQFRVTDPGAPGSRNTLRAGAFLSVDLGVGKSFRLPWEHHRLQFRWETFNLFNTVNFTSNASLTVTSPGSFGLLQQTTSTASQTFPVVPHNRVMQFGLRYEF